jgi:hypothetical protein
MWKCQKCGEQIEDTYDSCWRCAPEELPDDQKDLLKDSSEAKSGGRTIFWVSIVLGFIIVFLFDVGRSSLGLILGPLCAGMLAGGSGRGLAVGFMANFFFGLTVLFKAPNIGTFTFIASGFGLAPAAVSGVLLALLFGLGFGIWPGLVFGLVGGLLGKIPRKIWRSNQVKTK